MDLYYTKTDCVYELTHFECLQANQRYVYRRSRQAWPHANVSMFYYQMMNYQSDVDIQAEMELSETLVLQCAYQLSWVLNL